MFQLSVNLGFKRFLLQQVHHRFWQIYKVKLLLNNINKTVLDFIILLLDVAATAYLRT